MVSKKSLSTSVKGPAQDPAKQSLVGDVEPRCMVNLESVFAVLREQCPVSMQSDVQRLGAAFTAGWKRMSLPGARRNSGLHW